ncbi:MAG: IclR family transcriptional regulator [Deltaproteobacteria bacterium]|nr:IclR family transcriptional regulator [Deltaproteobacteria bacterium]
MAGVKFTNSLAKGLRVLESFSPASPKLKLQEIAEKTQLPKVTAFRFIRTLMTLGYIARDEQSRTYCLTPRVLSLGFTVLSSIELREVALPHLEQLSAASNQTVNLGVMDHTDVVYIERIKRKQILNIELYVGSRVSIYSTSIGRAILAFLPPANLQSLLPEILKNPEAALHCGAGGEKLLESLEAVRRLGYAMSDDIPFIPGVRTIAAPVFKAGGEVEGAINMPVFTQFVAREELTARYLPLLLETAGRISAERGYRGVPSGAAADGARAGTAPRRRAGKRAPES